LSYLFCVVIRLYLVFYLCERSSSLSYNMIIFFFCESSHYWLLFVAGFKLIQICSQAKFDSFINSRLRNKGVVLCVTFRDCLHYFIGLASSSGACLYIIESVWAVKSKLRDVWIRSHVSSSSTNSKVGRSTSESVLIRVLIGSLIA